MSFFSPTSSLSVRARMAFFEKPQQQPESKNKTPRSRRTRGGGTVLSPVETTVSNRTLVESRSPLAASDQSNRKPLEYLFEKPKPQFPEPDVTKASRPRISGPVKSIPSDPIVSTGQSNRSQPLPLGWSPLKRSDQSPYRPSGLIEKEYSQRSESIEAAARPRRMWPPTATSMTASNNRTKQSPTAPSDESRSPAKATDRSPRKPRRSSESTNKHKYSSPSVRKSFGGTPRRSTPAKAMLPTRGVPSPEVLFHKSSASPRKTFVDWTNFKNWSPTKWKKAREEAEECRAQNERLRAQMARLHHRIRCLDSDTGRNDLLKVIEEKDDEIDKKDEKLRVLDEKLHHIQLGLAQIEEERYVLQNKCSKMQKEKETMQRQLDNRENEINLLTRRCNTEAEKVKESNQLRTLNQSLSGRLAELEVSHGRSKQHEVEMEGLKKEVAQQQRARQELSELLTTLKSDHHIMTEKYRHSLSQVDALMIEKREWEAERHRWKHRAELDLEEQRLKYEQSKMELESTLQCKQREVEQLQMRLQETTEKVQRNRITSKKIEELQSECEKRLAELESSHQTQLSEYEEALNRAKSKVDEKNSTIASLREDVSRNLEQLMTTTSELHKLQEDAKLMDSMTADIEALEEERCSLTEVLHEKDTEIAEISAEILKLEIEKELLAQHKERADILQAKLTKAEEEQLALLASRETDARRTQDSIQQDMDSTCDLLRSQLQRTEQTAAEEELRFEMALSSREEKLELLQDELESLKSENQRLDAQHESEMVSLREELESCSESARLLTLTRDQLVSVKQESKEQIELLEKSLRAKDEQLAALFNEESQRRQDHQRSASMYQEEIDSIRKELQRAKTDLAVKDDEIRDLRIVELTDRDEAIAALEEEVRQLKEEGQSKRETSEKLVAGLEEQLQRLQARTADLERTADTRRTEHQAALDKLQQTIADLKRENDFADITLRDRERKLHEASTNIDTLTQRLRSFEQREEGLIAECSQLRSVVEELRRDRDKLSYVLDNELERRDSRDQEEELAQGLIEGLENRLAISETLVAQRQAELNKREEELGEQSARLKEMVARCKKAEMELQRHGSWNSVGEKEFHDLQCRLADRNAELQRLQREFQRQEESYLDEIHTERTRSELVESDLALARAKLEKMTQESKDRVELEKENAELKDKVRRQSAFLKRKIEKDRIMRTRSATTASRLSDRVSPRKAAAAATNTTAPPQFIRTPATTVVSEESADLDWELDDLLAD